MKNFVTVLLILVLIIVAIVLIKRAGGNGVNTNQSDMMMIEEGTPISEDPMEQDGDMIDNPGTLPQ